MATEVTRVDALPPEEAMAYFARCLALETDCWDVHEAMASGTPDFVLLDVRSPAAYEKAHVPGAISLPHREISEETLARWSSDTLFVVYCAGPHCNGADKAGLALSRLGRRVKLMIGGVTGWADEDFDFAEG